MLTNPNAFQRKILAALAGENVVTQEDREWIASLDTDVELPVSAEASGFVFGVRGNK